MATIDFRERFEHEPLDQTKGAFRLLKVCPDASANGLVQCDLWHDVTNTTYTCLSYVWGPDGDYQEILVNGKMFQCRRNLWEFLNVARTKYAAPPEVFWIDAICIDQTNISERNQQVAQMGDIYSSATTVLIWLGCDENVAYFLRVLAQLAAEDPDTEKHAKRLWYQGRTKQKETGWMSFFNNVYWTRAWITQEIFLARSIRLQAQETVITGTEMNGLAFLFPFLKHLALNSTSTADPRSCKDMALAMELYLRTMVGVKHQSLNNVAKFKSNVLDLSRFLRRRECQIPRDRIYSLRSIAEDGRKIPVDYGASDEQCFKQVLRALSDSMCMCSSAHVAEIFGYSSATIINPANRLPKVTIPMNISYVNVIYQGRPFLEASFSMLLATPVEGTYECSSCCLQFKLDVQREQTICLSERCRKCEGHLVIRKNAASGRALPVLSILSFESTELSKPDTKLIQRVPHRSVTCEVDLKHCRVNKSKAGPRGLRRWEQPRNSNTWGPEIVKISLQLDSWIQIALSVARIDGELCSEAREGLCSDSELSKACKEISIT
jgi:hypothetical protein